MSASVMSVEHERASNSSGHIRNSIGSRTEVRKAAVSSKLRVPEARASSQRRLSSRMTSIGTPALWPRGRGGRKRCFLVYRRAFEGGSMLLRVVSALVALLVGSVWIEGRAQSGGPVVSGAHRFERVADGIYYATASGTMNVGANSPIIVT